MATTNRMMRSGKLRWGPWLELVVSAIVGLALTVGLAHPAEAATRFVATTGNDTTNTCLSSGTPCKTITHALSRAVSGDTISVAAGTYNLALGETFPLRIRTTNVTLAGAGVESTILDATGANQGVVSIDIDLEGSTVSISGVTITGGAVSCASSECFAVGGGLANLGSIVTLTNVTVSGNSASCTGDTCTAGGGGLSNRYAGTLTLTNVTVNGNTVSCASAGCWAVLGGGIYSFNKPPGEGPPAPFMTITNSTVSGNTVSCASSYPCDAKGGGIYNDTGYELTSVITLTNVTVSENAVSCTGSGPTGCTAQGGGLYNGSGNDSISVTFLTNVTVTANRVTCSGTGCTAQGGGLHNTDRNITTFYNSILAKQLAGADCANSGTLTSNGFNLDSDNTCQLTQPSDHLGVSNPLLGPLQNNGGPTQTHALLPGSPAIDAGTNSGYPSTDQRGVTRPQGAACDIGAFEFGVNLAAVSLNGSAFHTGQTITYEATLIPGPVPPQVDIYLGVLLPDGVTFLSFVRGPGDTIAFAFGSTPVPFAANVTLTSMVVPFAYTFTGTEPVGTYFTYAGLAVAGSNPTVPTNRLSLGVQAFQFTP